MGGAGDAELSREDIMFTSISRWLAPAALTVFVAGAVFYPVICAADRADPLDPQAKVAALVYQSSLARYRPYRDAKPIGWREANDTVNRIGGWRAYAREAQQASPAGDRPPPPPDETDKTMPQGHGDHKSR
jgi:hypothetical protein